MSQQNFEKKTELKQVENALKISRRSKHLCYHVNFFFSGENIQHAIVPCQRKNQQMCKKMGMFI